MINVIDHLKSYTETLWINPNLKPFSEATSQIDKMSVRFPSLNEIKDADARLRRFAPFFETAFEETKASNGIIESPLISIEDYQKSVITFIGGRILGDWFLKADSHLPIAGSIKARGGVYEVIKFAEKVALEAGLITLSDSYEKFLSEPVKAHLSQYSIAVGSTGNLGLSIGTISRALGFKVDVHMSHDAKPWKIQMLRDRGANVILYDSDYSKAVEEGRKMADLDPHCHFIDDENSLDLFTGYAVAGLRLKDQFEKIGRLIDEDHPLFAYLPCGVGGAPGGIAYALKLIYGDAVHIFFAEPTHSPCMMLGMSTEKYDAISVNDIGIDNKTIADGLAVGRPSKLVGRVMSPLLSGIYTVSDEKLYRMLYLMAASQKLGLEPSALAGAIGPIKLFYDTTGFNYLKDHNLLDKMENCTHLSWATGGNLVPNEIMEADIAKGQDSDLMTL